MVIRRIVSVLLASTTCLALMPSIVRAQPVDPALTPQTQAPNGDDNAIVVTGSRVARSGFSTPTPVKMVDAEAMQRQGVVNVADALNNLPGFRAQSTPATVGPFAGNAGANLADLRGLGAQRTLVLVDGRRVVAGTVAGSGFSPSGSVDLNIIPSSLITRADVVTGGASAAYGSDAVAGVVNLVLNRKLEGISGSVQTGISERGDAREFFASLAGGTGFAGDRGHIVVAGEYLDARGVGDCSTRAFCAANYAPVNNNRPDLNGLARQVVLPNARMAVATRNGLITNGVLAGTEFQPDGSTIKHDYGTYYGLPNFQSGGSFDKENILLNDFPLVAPVKRYALFANVDYEIAPSLTATLQGSFAHTEGSTLSAEARMFGGSALRIQRDNAFLPTDLRDRMIAAGETSFTFGRFGEDIGSAPTTVSRDTYRVVAALEGRISSSVRWNAYYQYGQTDYSQVTTNNRIGDNLIRATDAVVDPVTQQIVCRSTLTSPINPLVQGCRPLNLFGEGRYAADAIAYAFGTATQNTRLMQHVAALSVQADVFDLPGGTLSVAAGGEYRVEDVVGTADAISMATRFTTSGGVAISGPATKVKEAFVEVVAPLARNVAFADTLDLNLAARVTDYSTSGSVTTWKAGLNWAPVHAVRFRVTRSRDIRAPNFFELYSGQTLSSQSVIDPRGTGGASQVPVRLGGNPGLTPEIANTITGGVVLSPTNRLQFSVDYYDIKVAQAIGSLGAQVILDRCQAGATELCPLIARDSGGVLQGVSAFSLNIAQLRTRGLDFEGLARFPIGSGELGVRLQGTYVFELTTVDGTGSVDRAGQNGAPPSVQSGVPNLVLTSSLTWDKKPYSLQVQGRYVSDGLFNAMLIGPKQDGYAPTLPNSISNNYMPARFYLNFNASVDVIDDGRHKIQMFFVANNLLDTEPPRTAISSFGAGNPAIYDVVGRSYKAGIRFKY